jgi:diacylglycerol O-acyltransferase
MTTARRKPVQRQPLNSQDEYFLDTDTHTAPTHVGGLEIYELPPGAGRDYMQQLFAYLKNSPVRAEPFNYRLVTVEPEEPKALGGVRLPGSMKRKPKPVRMWEKLDHVNVEEHLYLHALPRPGGQRELGELVARLHVNRLDRHRPLWEVHLIEGLEGGRFCIYTKLHHSQFDGKRGMSLVKYVRSPDPKARNIPPMWAVELPARPDKGAGRRDKDDSTFEKLASWGRAVRSMAQVRGNKPGQGVIAPYSAPASILNGPLTARRRIGTQTLSMPRLKAIGAAVEGGATVNEVLLAVCGGALRRYLLDRDALTQVPLIAACPVAMERKDDVASGNAVGQILVSLATHVANPKKRLQEVVESSRANKALMKELGQEAYSHYTELSMMPQVLSANSSFGHKVLNANLVISNVPGPREPQYVNGARIEAQYTTSMLLAGQALNITVCSFDEQLDMGILACPDLCPSPQRIAVYAGEEVAVLEDALGLKPPARKRKAAVRRAEATKAPARKTPVRKTAARKATAATTGRKTTGRKTTVRPPSAGGRR